MIKKLQLPLLSRVEILWKKKSSFCWSDSKTWTAPIITSWNFVKNKTFLLKWFENCNYPYYHELKFSKKYRRFYKVTWNFTLPLSSRVEIFSKIKQFCWSDSKTLTAPIITSWSFLKNRVVLLKRFQNLNCPFYHELKFRQQ